MSTWQPDWTTLNGIAASFRASTPLAARIATVTPVGGYVAIGLQANLTDILHDAGTTPLTNTLVIAVDTLTIPAGDTVITAPSVDIVARAFVVDGGGSATLHVRGAGTPGLQATTMAISGSVSVVFETPDGTPIGKGAAIALALTWIMTPQVLTAASDSATLSTSAASADIADTVHAPWAIVALQISSAIGGVLVDQDDPAAMALATNMLRWVTGCCAALVTERAAYTTVDYADIASLQSTSISLLAFTQAATSGATYVPILSTDIYQTQINALLQVARVYDQKLAELADQKQVDQVLASFAQTLGAINQDAETPLLNTLKRLSVESGSVQTQLTNAAVQLQEVGATLPDLQQALVDAINDQFQQELVKTAVDTLFTLATLYVGAAAAILGDPEVLAGESPAIIKAAIDITKELIDAGEKLVNTAINEGATAAGDAPSAGASQQAEQGAQYLAGSVASFGIAAGRLWAVVNAAVMTKGKINMSPDLQAVIDQLPDLSGFSVGGLDPVTYWEAVVVQTRAAVKPNESLSEATAYLAAVELAATYGKAVGDLQMQLLNLYTQGMAAFDQLQSVYRAEAQWADLKQSIEGKEAQIDAATGLLQRGYLAIKRNLVIAVDNYRAAFEYQWLQPSEIAVDVSMDLLSLERQAAASINSLEDVLAGTRDGAVRPRQTFQSVPYVVQQQDGLPLFTQENGLPLARWSITTDDLGLANQLSGNTGLYLTQALFELEGASQDGEVELQVATSGHYDNKLGNTTYRFVSEPVSMASNYMPGSTPTIITSWSFADAASYLAPSPYTNWTLTVVQGNWQGVNAIRMTVAGIMLQNP